LRRIATGNGNQIFTSPARRDSAGGGFASSAEAVEGFLAINGLNAAAVDFVVAGVEHAAYLAQLRQVSDHGVLDEFIGSAAGGFGKLQQAGFRFWLEVHYHVSEFREGALNCQSDIAVDGLVPAPSSVEPGFQSRGPTLPKTSASYYRARYYDPSTGRFLSEDPARLEPNAFAYAANSPVNFTDPTGLTKGIPTDCEELRKYIEKLYRIFIAKEDQYDPEEDGSGMIPKRGGGFHAPGIHYQNLIFLQLKLLKALKQWDDTCGGRNNPPPVCDPERVKQPIPAPVFRKPTVAEATGAAAAAYILYRVLRFLPSLYPPLWWTIPENLALP